MPQFNAGESKTARVTMRNPTAKAFDYTGFLYMGTALAVMSEASFRLEAGQEKQVLFPVTMPSVPGTYPVHIGVFSGGKSIALYKAIEDVNILWAITVPLSKYYADFGYWLQSELLDINGKVFTSFAEEGWDETLMDWIPATATIKEPVSLSNPRQLTVKWRNLSIKPGDLRSIGFLVYYYESQIPRYVGGCPLPPIGGEATVNINQLYVYGEAEKWVEGVYNIYIGVSGISYAGIGYGLGSVVVKSAVRLTTHSP